MAGERSKPRPRGRALLLILATVVGGLLLGAGISMLAENKPFEQRSTARLVRDLRKKDSPLDHLRQRLWPVLPVSITDRLSHLSPLPANVVRQLAAVELRRRVPRAQEAMPALIGALRDSHSGVRGMALQALAGFGPGAKAAVPEVLPILDSVTNAVLRSEAVRALVAIAPDDPQIRARLLAIVRSEPPFGVSTNSLGRRTAQSRDALRSSVLRLLDKLTQPDNEIVAILLAELARGDDQQSIEIIGTLQRIGPITPEIIPALVGKLRQNAGTAAGPAVPQAAQDDVTAAALRALQRLARSDNEAVPMLIACLRDVDVGLSARILQSLGQIGPITPEVVPTVMGGLKISDPRIQLSAVGALGIIGAEAAPAVSLLCELLHAQLPKLTNRLALEADDLDLALQERILPETLSPRVRMRAPRVMRAPEIMANQVIQALAKIGRAAGEAVPALTQFMSVLKTDLRYDAALALWQIDRTNAPAHAALIESLNTPSPDFPRRFTRHFRSMGAEELPILIAALDHLDDPVRIAAMNALSALGPKADAAAPVLERIADDPSDSVRTWARQTLDRVQADSQRENSEKLSGQPR